jgi:hypothetical protein
MANANFEAEVDDTHTRARVHTSIQNQNSKLSQFESSFPDEMTGASLQTKDAMRAQSRYSLFGRSWMLERIIASHRRDKCVS